MRKTVLVVIVLLFVVLALPSLAAARWQVPKLRAEHQLGLIYDPGQVRLTGSEVIEWPTRVGTFSLALDAVQPVVVAGEQAPAFERMYFQTELAYTRFQWGIDWTVGVRGRWQPGVKPTYGAFLVAAWSW